VSHPLRGQLYELNIPSAEATHVVVLTEDVWNAQMSDSVVVPVYRWPDASPSLLLVALDEDLRGNCTRVQSMGHEFIGNWVGSCPDEPWVRIRVGVRKFLDVDRRIAKTPPPPLRVLRSDWWPHQNRIHFATNTAIGPSDKLYAIISDNDWNSLPEALTAAAVRLTSKTKRQRLRWEVPLGSSFVVTGDIYSVPVVAFEQKPPRTGYPTALTDDESAAIAVKQRSTLSLS